MEELLNKLNLQIYTQNFHKNKVIVSDLIDLDDEDLTELIPDKYPRKRFRQYIDENIKNNNNSGQSFKKEKIQNSSSDNKIESISVPKIKPFVRNPTPPTPEEEFNNNGMSMGDVLDEIKGGQFKLKKASERKLADKPIDDRRKRLEEGQFRFNQSSQQSGKKTQGMGFSMLANMARDGIKKEEEDSRKWKGFQAKHPPQVEIGVVKQRIIDNEEELKKLKNEQENTEIIYFNKYDVNDKKIEELQEEILKDQKRVKELETFFLKKGKNIDQVMKEFPNELRKFDLWVAKENQKLRDKEIERIRKEREEEDEIERKRLQREQAERRKEKREREKKEHREKEERRKREYERELEKQRREREEREKEIVRKEKEKHEKREREERRKREKEREREREKRKRIENVNNVNRKQTESKVSGWDEFERKKREFEEWKKSMQK